MVKVTDKDFYMDGYLNSNLEIIKRVIKKDWDMIFVIDGMEGAGKSVLAQQVAYFCDPTFNIDQIAFSPKEFKKAVLKAKKYQAIIYDEAYAGLSSRGAMSRINRTLVKMLAEIRQRNLFLIVVVPCFFDLDKYVALWRSKVLLHVYTKGEYERGFFNFFNIDKKKALYMTGKKYYSYGKIASNFFGRFTNFYVIDEKEYRKRKLQAMRAEEEETKEVGRIAKEIRQTIAENIENPSLELTTSKKATILGITDRTIFRYLSQIKENA